MAKKFHWGTIYASYLGASLGFPGPLYSLRLRTSVVQQAEPASPFAHRSELQPNQTAGQLWAEIQHMALLTERSAWSSLTAVSSYFGLHGNHVYFHC